MLSILTSRNKVASGSLRNEQGQDLVEFALILPLLLLLILGIIEFGILVLDYNTISNAAREGARYGIIMPKSEGPATCESPPAGSIVAAACRLTSGLSPANLTVQSVYNTSGGTGLGTVNVTVRYRTSLITGPIIEAAGLPGTFNLPPGQATMACEQ